jgi:uncharacterized membrane protein
MNIHDKDIVMDNTLESRKLLHNDSIQWIRSAFKQFKAFPFVWITLAIIYVGIAFISLQNELLKFLAVLLMPIFNGGLFIAAATGDRGISPRVEQLFSAFKTDALKLMITGAFWGLISVVFHQFLYAVIFYGIAEPEKLSTEQLFTYFHSLPSTTYLIAAGLLWIFTFLSIAYNVIPGLIIFNRLTPLTAYRFAFSACLRNWQPLMLYMVLLAFLGIIATLPLLLGWIVLLPMVLIINFYIWRELFTFPLPKYS